MNHQCEVFTKRLVWSDWIPEGDLRRREGRRIPFCKECGNERAKAAPSAPSQVEFESVSPAEATALTAAERTTALELVRQAEHRGMQVFAEELLRKLGRQGIKANLAEEHVLRFLEAGWVRLRLRLKGTQRELAAIRVLNPAELEEAADPGCRERREATKRLTSELHDLEHPLADEVVAILSELPANHSDVRLILAAMTVHAVSGAVLSEHAFSTRCLHDSKLLRQHRAEIIPLIEDPARFRIREGVALTPLGGAGSIVLAGTTIDLANVGPMFGLSRDALLKVEEVSPGPDGLLVVTKLAVFEACSRGEVEEAGGALVVWSPGYPGEGERRLVEAAVAGGATVRVWADMGLDGVRIARLVERWAGAAEPFRMSPDDLAAASFRRPLSDRARAAIEDDLERNPEALLADTLEAILDDGSWVEQETLL